MRAGLGHLPAKSAIVIFFAQESGSPEMHRRYRADDSDLIGKKRFGQKNLEKRLRRTAEDRSLRTFVENFRKDDEKCQENPRTTIIEVAFVRMTATFR